MMARVAKAIAIAAGLLLVAGCWNGRNNSINLGSVSVGQQMIDLKTALEQQAITQTEYDRLRDTLMSIDRVCDNTEDD